MTGATTKDFVLDGTRIISETSSRYTMIYLYDETGSPIGIKYRSALDTAGVYSLFFFEKNLQGDVVAIYNEAGTKIATYTYDAWGNFVKSQTSGVTYSTADTYVYNNNPFTYRGYYYDSETGWYYLQTRYYDPEIGRFISADNQLATGQDLTGANLYAYCGNNPVNRTDYTGEAWWHWALAAAVVVGCAVATVATCGGFAAAAGAVALVASGTAAATTAATVAAGAFIGSSVALGTAAMATAMNSSSVEEFMDGGNWETVGYVAFSAVYGGYYGYQTHKANNPSENNTSHTGDISGGRNIKTSDINFARKPQQHMANPNRRVPVNIQADAIRYGTASPDPRGTGATQYTIKMYRNGTPYQLDVVFDWEKMMVYHFEYHH